MNKKKRPVSKNDELVLDITGMTSGGSGVGRYEGMTVFVQGALQGERVQAHIIKVKSTYAVGKLMKVIIKSEERLEPGCEVYGACGGCCFQHIAYDGELRAKLGDVNSALERIGGLSVRAKEIISLNQTEAYRNKAQYPVGTGRDGRAVIGFYARKSHRIVDCDSCLLEPREFRAIIESVKKWLNEFKISVYDEASHTGLIRHIYLRKAFATGEIMLCVVTNGESLPHSNELITLTLSACGGIKSIIQNINTEKTNVILSDRCRVIYGSDYITDRLCRLEFRLSALSFYQVNPRAAELLYDAARRLAGLRETDILLDLYCGTGTIGLSMAKYVRRLVGAEIVPQAIENAKQNARLNGIENAEFYCADAAEISQKLLSEGFCPTVVVLDPPRKGCSRETLLCVCKMRPERIVYVSCDPATLARDCAFLKKEGYLAEQAVAVDMFPRTGHVETVVLLSQVSKPTGDNTAERA